MSLFCLKRQDEPTLLASSINLLIAAILLVLGFWWVLSQLQYRLDFSFLPYFSIRIADGLILTLAITICALILSLFIGILTAGALHSRIILIRSIAHIYVTLIRGTPLIMQIYLFYYLVGTALMINNTFIAGVVILAIFEGAYMAEIVRGGYTSLQTSQLEAAKAVGFTRWQALRFVIFPQMIARTLPALTGQFASLIKDSSLLSMISITEITQMMREISAGNLKLIECYVTLGVLYLILTLPIMAISRRLEMRYQF